MSFSALHNCHERDPTVDALCKVCQLTLFGIKMNTHVISFHKVESKVEIIAGSEDGWQGWERWSAKKLRLRIRTWDLLWCSWIFYTSGFEICKRGGRASHMARGVDDTTTRKMFGFGFAFAYVDDFVGDYLLSTKPCDSAHAVNIKAVVRPSMSRPKKGGYFVPYWCASLDFRGSVIANKVDLIFSRRSCSFSSTQDRQSIRRAGSDQGPRWICWNWWLVQTSL